MKTEKSSEYKKLVEKHSPKSKTIKNSALAFLVGGIICFLGEWLAALYIKFGASESIAYTLVTVTYIILSATATALGFFDALARHAGAGTLLPVTGFANSITSSAIDTRSEGFIAGVGKGIFTVAGPVILYSTLAGTAYGFIYYIYRLVA